MPSARGRDFDRLPGKRNSQFLPVMQNKANSGGWDAPDGTTSGAVAWARCAKQTQFASEGLVRRGTNKANPPGARPIVRNKANWRVLAEPTARCVVRTLRTWGTGRQGGANGAKQTQFPAGPGGTGPGGRGASGFVQTNPIPARRAAATPPRFQYSIIPPFQPDGNRAKQTQFGGTCRAKQSQFPPAGSARGIWDRPSRAPSTAVRDLVPAACP